MAMGVPDALSRPGRMLAWAMTAAGRHALERGDARELTPTRRRVLEAARDALPMAAKDLARLGACGTGVVAGIEHLGWFEKVAVAPRSDSEPPDWRHRGPQLSPEQAEAAEALVAAVRRADFSVTLIDGVTGSGKTEVYFQAIAAALEAGRQAPLLFPELAPGLPWLAPLPRPLRRLAPPVPSQLTPPPTR